MLYQLSAYKQESAHNAYVPRLYFDMRLFALSLIQFHLRCMENGHKIGLLSLFPHLQESCG